MCGDTDEAECGISDVARRTHLFGVLEVLEEGLLVPGDTLIDVRSGVGVTLGLTSLVAEDTGVHKRVSLSMSRKAQNPYRRTRGGWGRPCEARPSREYDTERSGS